MRRFILGVAIATVCRPLSSKWCQALLRECSDRISRSTFPVLSFTVEASIRISRRW